MDNAAFRAAFPQFADTTAYPDARLDAVAGFVAPLLSTTLWGDSLPYATMLYVAHILSIGGSSVAGSGSGASTGVTQSKTVDKVSVTYDTGATTFEGQAYWNLSRYGIELYQLMMLFGAGPIHLMGDTFVYETVGNGLWPFVPA